MQSLWECTRVGNDMLSCPGKKTKNDAAPGSPTADNPLVRCSHQRGNEPKNFRPLIHSFRTLAMKWEMSALHHDIPSRPADVSADVRQGGSGSCCGGDGGNDGVCGGGDGGCNGGGDDGVVTAAVAAQTTQHRRLSVQTQHT